MDLSNLSINDLRTLQQQIAAEIKGREGKEVEKARAQILEIARSVGISLKDLITSSKPPREGGKKVAMRYQSPNDRTKEWTGRGRAPQWVKDLQAEGKQPIDLQK